PPGEPEALWVTALVASSLVSRVAVVSSGEAASSRSTNRRACLTWWARPGNLRLVGAPRTSGGRVCSVMVFAGRSVDGWIVPGHGAQRERFLAGRRPMPGAGHGARWSAEDRSILGDGVDLSVRAAGGEGRSRIVRDVNPRTEYAR